ncbi:MAG: DUF418 domain-containing protein [Pseudomonadota bacterium]
MIRPMTRQCRVPSARAIVPAERIEELDILRGFALLGVLVANLVIFSASNNISTDAQQQGFIVSQSNRIALFLVSWLVDDKANTLFAVLFGAGFWIQWQRLNKRGAPAMPIYLRRLSILFLIGVLNLFLLWPWDILQQYALVGLLLVLLRNLPAKIMLVAGGALALAGRPLLGWWRERSGLSEWAEATAFSADAVARRQAAYTDGNYIDWVEETARLVLTDYLAGGLIAVWALYVLGRFLLGAYLIRAGWLRRAIDDPKLLRRTCLAALVVGLSLEGAHAAMIWGYAAGPDWLVTVLHAPGSLILALGYASALVLANRRGVLRRLALLFAPVGQMALTNYLVQGVFIGAILYGFHGGLGFAGRLEPAAAAIAAMAAFVVQAAVSHWWLLRHRRGPIETLWRWGTYGTRAR